MYLGSESAGYDAIPLSAPAPKEAVHAMASVSVLFHYSCGNLPSVDLLRRPVVVLSIHILKQYFIFFLVHILYLVTVFYNF
jgi:hypothetical protein